MRKHHSKTYITKSTGEQALFSVDKLRDSLLRSGADENTIDDILTAIEDNLYPGMTTRKIYRQAFSMLRLGRKHTAARYKLKEAINELGPSGYPFERYIGELFRLRGYDLKVGIVLPGQCVTHELDFFGRKGSRVLMGECKFRNRANFISDVKVPLYIHSRFRDVQAHLRKQPDYHNVQFEGWIVTNTRFSSDAIQYGECSGLHMLSWDYPEHASLRHWIDSAGLHPITSLTTLNKAEKRFLLDQKVALSQELLEHPELLHRAHISQARQITILNEVRSLCQHS